MNLFRRKVKKLKPLRSLCIPINNDTTISSTIVESDDSAIDVIDVDNVVVDNTGDKGDQYSFVEEEYRDEYIDDDENDDDDDDDDDDVDDDDDDDDDVYDEYNDEDESGEDGDENGEEDDEYDDFDSIVEKPALDNTQVCAVVDILKEKGIERHYLSLAGGRLKSAAIKYIMQRSALLLVWTYKSETEQSIPLMKNDVLLWFFQIITTSYSLVEKFLTEYLDTSRKFSPSTCINYICDITKAVTWFVWFREDRIQEFKIGGYEERGIMCILQQLKKSLKPSLQKQRLANSLENMIADRRFPSGGIAQLQGYMIDDIQWAYSIDAHFVARARQMYNRFLSILVSALYVFSPQGRVGGIQDVRIQQYSELLHDGYTTSSHFKTVGKFLLQPITISNIVKKILISYKTVRELRSRSSSCHSDFFFVTFLGLPHDRLGRLITTYFHSKNVNLHITTTSLRSLVESEANDLNRNGRISDGDFKMLQNINGHSEKTSEQYYVKQKAYDAVQSGNRIFKLITENSAEPQRVPPVSVSNYRDMQNSSTSSNSIGTESPNALRDIHTSSSNSSPFTFSRSNVETEDTSSHNKRQKRGNMSAVQQSYDPKPGERFFTPTKPNHRSNSVEEYESARNSISDDNENINIKEQSTIEWGREHPEISDPHRRRNKWTSAELDYIGALAEKLG